MAARGLSTDAGNQQPEVHWERSRFYGPEKDGMRVRIPNTCNNPVRCTFPFIVKQVQQAQLKRAAKIARGEKIPTKKVELLPVPPAKPTESLFELTEVETYVPFDRWTRSRAIAPELIPAVPTQDNASPPRARGGGGKKASRKHLEREQVEAMWTGGFPKSIDEWKTRKREVDRVHGHMVSQNLPELVENSYYERHEIFQLWARFKCLCTLSKTAYGIDRRTFMEFLEPQMGDEDPIFVEKVFDVVDADGNTFIDWPEFLQAMSILEKCTKKDRLMFLFRVINDGCLHLTKEDAKQTFKATVISSEEDVAEKLAEGFLKFLPEPDAEGRIYFNDVMRFLDSLPSDFNLDQFDLEVLEKNARTSEEKKKKDGHS